MNAPPEDRVKSKALAAIESLPENATWDDAIYSLYVRQKIELGLDDAANGRTVSVDEVRRLFGLPQ